MLHQGPSSQVCQVDNSGSHVLCRGGLCKGAITPQIRSSRVTCSVSVGRQAQPQPQDADAIPRRGFRKRCEKTVHQLDSHSALGPEERTAGWGSGAQNQDSTQGGQGGVNSQAATGWSGPAGSLAGM